MKSTALLTPAEESALQDEAAGFELTAQYRRAVSGMREVLIFGAMLMQIEARLAPVVHVRTPGGKLGGSSREGGGIKGWLTENAPEISHSTAFRFLGITRKIATEYETIVGARIAKKFDLPALVLADTGSLSDDAKLKQGELFDYVSGTSQRSWLDAFKPKREIHLGGDTRPIDPETGERINHARKPLDERLEIARITARDNLKAVVNGLADLLDTPATGFSLLSKTDQEVLRGAFLDYGRRLKEIK